MMRALNHLPSPNCSNYMRNGLLILAYLLATLTRFIRPGGTKSVAAENILLRQQLIILKRQINKPVRLSPSERLVFAFSAQFLRASRIIKNAVVIRPNTILKIHRALKKRKYHQIFGSKPNKPGPKGPSKELVKLVIQIKERNTRFGCTRIAMEVSRIFGIEINKDVVRRILSKHYRPKPDSGGPSWLTFLGDSKDSLWSIDFFRCESALLKSHWVLAVMDQHTRRIIGFGIQKGSVDGINLCRMFNQATSGIDKPPYLSSDNDPLFRYHRWQANLRIMDIQEIKSIPYVPQSHPFVERPIGTVRRECLDKTLFWNERDLANKLEQFRVYYNENRAHSSLDGFAPEDFNEKKRQEAASVANFGWQKHCRGLFELPVSA